MASLNITVTQLKHACLDSKWRKKWLADPTAAYPNHHRAKNPFPVMGGLFHKIVENYVNWLVSGDPDVVARLEDDAAHWETMWDRFTVREMEKLLVEGKFESAFHVKNCLRVFCRRLEALRQMTPDFKTWGDLYLAKEFSVSRVPCRYGPRSLYVSGQIDAVRVRPEGGLEIVDYKLSKGDNLAHDLLQVSIYAFLLSQTQARVPYSGLLEYYHPDFEGVPVSHESMNTIFREMVEPVLRELSGEIPPGRPGPDREPMVEPPLPEGEEPDRKTDRVKKTPPRDHSRDIQKCYGDFKLGVEVIDFREAPQLVRYRVKPQAGIKVVALANRAEDLQVHLGLHQAPIINVAGGFVTVDLAKETPDMVHWRDVVADPAYRAEPGLVAFPVGVGVDNRVITADLADAGTCHLLVAGGTGSGKSEFLKAMVASLIRKHTPSSLKMSIVDPKFLTFGPLKKSPFLAGPLIHNVKEAILCLEGATKEMNRRYRQLADEKFENLADRFKAGRQDLPFHLIIFDEYADMVVGDKKDKKVFENLASKLAAKGRAAGLHLILATQRPDARVVTGVIKANLPFKICFKVSNAANSQIVLDQTGADRLLGRGDLLCDRGQGVERAQGPYISPDELAAVTG